MFLTLNYRHSAAAERRFFIIVSPAADAAAEKTNFSANALSRIRGEQLQRSLWQWPFKPLPWTFVRASASGGRRGKVIVEKSADMRYNKLLNFAGVTGDYSDSRFRERNAYEKWKKT